MRADTNTTEHERAACEALGITLDEWIRVRNSHGRLRCRRDMAIRRAVAKHVYQTDPAATYHTIAAMFGTKAHTVARRMITSPATDWRETAPSARRPPVRVPNLDAIRAKRLRLEPLTREETAAVLGVSAEYVRQVERRGLAKMRDALRSERLGGRCA